MMDKRVVLGVAHGDGAKWDMSWSMMVATNLDNRNRKLIASVLHKGGLYVEDNREEIASDFMLLDEDPPWLLFIDTDIEFKLPDIYRLIDGAREPGVYSGLYFSLDVDRSKTPPALCNKAVVFNRDEERQCWTTVSPIHSAGLHQVDGVGTGFCLIHREVFAAIRKSDPENPFPWFTRNMYSLVDGKWIRDTEDLCFCARAKKLGFSVRYNGGVIVTHHKAMPLGLQTLELMGVEMNYKADGFKADT